MSDGLLGLDALRQTLAEPLEASPPGPEILARAASEACALAREAYERNSASAVASAERVLYTLNVNNAFTPPVQGVPGVIWNVLTRAKMRAAVHAPRVPDTLELDEMNRLLLGAVEEHGAATHPFVDRIVADPDIKGLVVFAKNWFTTAHGFTAQLIAMAQRAKPAMRDVVLRNLADEFDGIDHELLRARFRERVGAQYEPSRAVNDPEHLTEAFGVLNYRTGVCSLNNTAYALGSFYSVEAATPPMCKHLVDGLRKRGFEEEAIRTFSLHVDVDEDHAGEWLEAINGQGSLSPAERAMVVRGALGQLAQRRAWFETMQTYVYGKR